MRQAVVALIALLSILPCSAADTAPARPAAAAKAASTKWVLDPENSSVTFACKHVLSTVRGLLPQPSGTVTIDETNPANSSVNATIDPSRITTGVEERDNHLKSADFFDVAKYPTVTFVSSKVSKSGNASYS